MSLLTTKEDYAREFRTNILKALSWFPSGFYMATFRKIIEMKDPVWLIEKTGPFLMNNRFHIIRHDVKYFLDYDWSKQRKDWLKLTYGYGEGIVNTFEKGLLETIKTKSSSSDDDEAKEVKVLLSTVLKYYASYLLLQEEEDVTLDET